MTAENADFVRRFFEELNRGDVEALVARLTPGFEMGAEPRTYRGPEGFRSWFDSFSEIMEVPNRESRFLAVGDRVVAPHTLHARGRETGIDTEQYTVHVWHLRDGKAEMLEVFATLDGGAGGGTTALIATCFDPVAGEAARLPPYSSHDRFAWPASPDRRRVHARIGRKQAPGRADCRVLPSREGGSDVSSGR